LLPKAAMSRSTLYPSLLERENALLKERLTCVAAELKETAERLHFSDSALITAKEQLRTAHELIIKLQDEIVQLRSREKEPSAVLPATLLEEDSSESTPAGRSALQSLLEDMEQLEKQLEISESQLLQRTVCVCFFVVSRVSFIVQEQLFAEQERNHALTSLLRAKESLAHSPVDRTLRSLHAVPCGLCTQCSHRGQDTKQQQQQDSEVDGGDRAATGDLFTQLLSVKRDDTRTVAATDADADAGAGAVPPLLLARHSPRSTTPREDSSTTSPPQSTDSRRHKHTAAISTSPTTPSDSVNSASTTSTSAQKHTPLRRGRSALSPRSVRTLTLSTTRSKDRVSAKVNDHVLSVMTQFRQRGILLPIERVCIAL